MNETKNNKLEYIKSNDTGTYYKFFIEPKKGQYDFGTM
jgi:hypothetical protein